MSLQRHISVWFYCWCFCHTNSTCSILIGRTIDYGPVYFLSSSAPSLSLNIPFPPAIIPLILANIGGGWVGGNEYNWHSHPAIEFNFWWAAVGKPDLDWSRNLWNFSNDDGWRNLHHTTTILYQPKTSSASCVFESLWVCTVSKRIGQIKDQAMLLFASMLPSMLLFNVYCCCLRRCCRNTLLWAPSPRRLTMFKKKKKLCAHSLV